MANVNLAIIKKDVVDTVVSKVREFQQKGELCLPTNYSSENAMKSAWLLIQEVENKDHKMALDVCTQNSVANSLLKMAVQGLNPSKNQCYFIVYGNKLVLQRSYFGTMHVAKTVEPDVKDIFAQEVYKEDVFEYEISRGTKIITKHSQALANVNKSEIVAAYCSILYADGHEETTVMTLDEIKQAWRMSKMNPVTDKGEIKADSTHGKFTAMMAKKTVTNRACGIIVNASDDGNLIVKAFKETDAEIVEAEVEAEIAENANKTFIDVETGEITDAEPTDEANQVFEDIAADDLP